MSLSRHDALERRRGEEKREQASGALDEHLGVVGGEGHSAGDLVSSALALLALLALGAVAVAVAWFLKGR
jgi:hypothetical protein